VALAALATTNKETFTAAFHGLAGGLPAVRALLGRGGNTTSKDADDKRAKLWLSVKASATPADAEDHWVAIALARRPAHAWSLRVNADGTVTRTTSAGADACDDDDEDTAGDADNGADGKATAWEVDMKRTGKSAPPSAFLKRMQKAN